MYEKTSAFQRIRTSDAFATLVVATAIFSGSFGYDLVIPFTPQLLEYRLHQPTIKVQLWTSILLGTYGAFFAVGNVLAGICTDRSRSKKTPFFLGMLIMIVSCLMFFLGRDVAVIVAARALQGLSASFVWVSGLAFLNSHVKPSSIGTAMGYVTVGIAVGEITGPIVGGVMYEHAGHFAVFGLILAILGVDLLLRAVLQDKPLRTSKQQELTSDDEYQSLLDDGASCLSATSSREPIEIKYINVFGFPMERDSFSSFGAACVVGTVRYTLETALVIFVAQHFGWSTSAGGGIIFALLSPAVFGPLTGRYVAKNGPRRFTVVLFSIMALALIVLAFCTQPTIAIKILFVSAVTVVGCCQASLETAQTIAFSVAAKRREIKAKQESRSTNTGSAFGGFNMAWSIGTFAGPLASEVFIDHINWMAFCVFLAALSGVSAVTMAFTWEHWEIPDDY